MATMEQTRLSKVSDCFRVYNVSEMAEEIVGNEELADWYPVDL